ncbi:putative 2-succinylbenzoate--CoA ligase [Dyadobacter sp. CECT 9275]|uniref:2-succinylbenzoate--CoA ligase n=1 Tax=Dyadobacter helix TaxID=2822344 RepID=A0A916N5H1_9BACT|nr:AMP-binding protein [Dyadobacter sp. CECT 9275]CAG4998274.1 putative 2-succinylbenzoate--CoA ligase [Dyadobacter sp. CECT 9275]
MWQTSRETLLSQPPPENPYELKCYDFLKEWINGTEVITLFTSGSTGTPKPIDLYRNQLISSALMTGEALKLSAGSRALVCLNVNYIAGMMMLIRGMELGWELTITEPSANPLLHLNHALRFDFTSMVPMQLAACLHDTATREAVTRFDKILLGGAPVSPVLQHEISLLTNQVYHSYGMTETVSHVALKQLSPMKEDDYNVLPGIRFGVDERGCLYISGAVTNSQIVQTNDLVEITSKNTFKWIGRADNIINSGGVKIVLDRIDEIVSDVFFRLNYTHVFFTWFEEDNLLGQKLILMVEARPDQMASEQVLVEIRKQVSAYETPKHVYFAEQFFRTATDKIDKRRTAQTILKLPNE